MLLTEYIVKAKELTIEQANNGLFYLNPMWRNILNDNELSILDISDSDYDEEDISEILKLEVEKRNTENSLKPYILSWLHDIITASVEPAILQEETDYLKNLTEYLKANKEAQILKDKEEWDKFKST
ncbi:MAG: hypothetical protein J6Y78_16185 [Paludibacteraceae bacterium]|nr:hypothetical protein [Paludibacteraceae bacterium]